MLYWMVEHDGVYLVEIVNLCLFLSLMFYLFILATARLEVSERTEG